MDERITALPAEAHTLAGQIEDQLAIWAERDPARHRFEVRRAGERACRLVDDLIHVLHQMREGLAAEVGEYDDARRGTV